MLGDASYNDMWWKAMKAYPANQFETNGARRGRHSQTRTHLEDVMLWVISALPKVSLSSASVIHMQAWRASS